MESGGSIELGSILVGEDKLKASLLEMADVMTKAPSDSTTSTSWRN